MLLGVIKEERDDIEMVCNLLSFLFFFFFFIIPIFFLNHLPFLSLSSMLKNMYI